MRLMGDWLRRGWGLEFGWWGQMKLANILIMISVFLASNFISVAVGYPA
jgi:hypothetical protein